MKTKPSSAFMNVLAIYVPENVPRSYGGAIRCAPESRENWYQRNLLTGTTSTMLFNNNDIRNIDICN